MHGLPPKVGSRMPKLVAVLGAKSRARLSHSDSSSPQRGQKAAAKTGQFKPKGPK